MAEDQDIGPRLANERNELLHRTETCEVLLEDLATAKRGGCTDHHAQGQIVGHRRGEYPGEARRDRLCRLTPDRKAHQLEIGLTVQGSIDAQVTQLGAGGGLPRHVGCGEQDFRALHVGERIPADPTSALTRSAQVAPLVGTILRDHARGPLMTTGWQRLPLRCLCPS